MRYETGDRVVAARGIGGFLRPAVPSGTPGVVIKIDQLEQICSVIFANGRKEDVGEDQIGPLPRSDS